MPGGLYHDINAFIDGRVNDIIQTTSDNDFYTDRDIDLNELECNFNPWKGDRVKLSIIREDPPRVFKIEPWV